MSTTSRAILPSSVVVATDGQVSASLERDQVVLNVTSGHYFRLQGTGGRIWELLREPVRVDRILETIVEEYHAERSGCARDLIEFLGELKDRELIEIVSS